MSIDPKTIVVPTALRNPDIVVPSPPPPSPPPPPSGSFDWTHGLGNLRLMASEVMNGVWGVGAAGTRIIDSQYGSDNASLQSYETYRTFFSTLGDYVTYKIDPPANNFTWDLFLDCRTFLNTIPYGIHIGNWRHVIVLAPGISLLNQDLAWLQNYNPAATRGNGLFEAANKDTYGSSRSNFTPGKDLWQVNDQSYTGGNIYYNKPGTYDPDFDNQRLPRKGWNIHARMPGACMIRFASSGYTWIEGANLNANGLQGDGVISTRDGLDVAVANQTRRFYYSNCRITNYEGQSRHENYGDGIHGDSHHSQNGGERMSQWENVWIISGQEGNVHTGTLGDYSEFMTYHLARNYQYILLDPSTNFINLSDYSNPPPGEKSNGAAISYKALDFTERTTGGPPGWEIENLWFENKFSNRIRFQDGSNPRTLETDAQINEGISPIIFAPAGKTGTNYRQLSPSNDYFNSL